MLNKEIIIFCFIKIKFISGIFLLYKKIIIFYFINIKLGFNEFFSLNIIMMIMMMIVIYVRRVISGTYYPITFLEI